MGKFDECIFVDVPSVDEEQCTRLNRRAVSTRMILSLTKDRLWIDSRQDTCFSVSIICMSTHPDVILLSYPGSLPVDFPLFSLLPSHREYYKCPCRARKREREIPRVYFLAPKFIHLRIFNAFIRQISTSISIFLLARSLDFLPSSPPISSHQHVSLFRYDH